MRRTVFALALLPMLAHAQADSIAPDQTGMGSLSATDFAKGIRAGWNVGNSLEAVDNWTVAGVYTPNETSWGNPKITQLLIDSVKAAGFDAIRLPVSWSNFSDATTYTISATWMARVKEVVDYAIDRDMYVLMNEHWDGGWLQPVAADSAKNNERLRAIWKQVAKQFRDYGPKLIFAGTNEVMKDGDYGTPTSEYYGVQNNFNQVFVNTVRATGGKNSYRYLVVQAFNTNIDHGVNFLKIPTDPTSKRMMVEVHFYDPYDFTLNQSNTTVTQWGAGATSSKTATWGNESSVDAQMSKMKTSFADKGYPVVIGEYGTILKNTTDNPAYRAAWTKYVTQAAVKIGALPFYWDNGSTGTNGMGIFDRTTGKVVHSNILQAIMTAAPTVSVAREARLGSDLVRRGSTILSESAEAIALHDLAGRQIRGSILVDGRARLSLEGLESGLYVARSGARTSTVLVR